MCENCRKAKQSYDQKTDTAYDNYQTTCQLEHTRLNKAYAACLDKPRKA